MDNREKQRSSETTKVEKEKLRKIAGSEWSNER